MTAERRIAVEDSVYGDFFIETPVILDLVNSDSIKRLKGLNQYGIPDRYYHRTNFSRCEHSVGVMLLLRSLGASEEEQAAGLLHDVSHRSFSHIYDWVTGSSELEDSQDNNHVNFMLSSEIPNILDKYGYGVDRITDYHHFGLLERDSPDLCADRIDYALREIDPQTSGQIFQGLSVHDNQIVAKDLKTAATFGSEFLSLQTNHWGGYEGVARYHHFSEILKLALQTGVVVHSDFLEDDEHVVNKLETSGNRKILTGLKYLRQNPLPVANKGIIVRKKFRYIDPPFLLDGKLVKLSSVDDNFAANIERARADNEKGVLVPGRVF